jgi:uncharacterized protein
MTEHIKKQISLLVKLQEVDSRCFYLNKKLEKIPSILGELDSRLKFFEEKVTRESGILDELKKKYREHDAMIQQNDAQIKKSKEKLGLVKNNKEYQAILKEIEEIQGKKSEIEDSQIEILDEIEKAEKQARSAKEELEKFSGETGAKKEGVLKENEEGKSILEELALERSGVAETVDLDFLKKYEQVKKIVGNLAIVRVVDLLCLACNVNIPPQRYNELQRLDSLQFCPNCHRIIYWENDKDGSE